jgi:ABC-type branched-subunit amino acid transport system ATPase component/branched-subunit amino acid ABC-type transport system permease component
VSEHIAFLLGGLGSGGVFAALAMALVVTYRSSGVVNFATGAMALYTAVTYAYLRQGELVVPIPGLPSTVDIGAELGFAPAAAIALVISALLGALLYAVVFRPLRTAPAVAKAVASVGVTIVLQGLLAVRLGTQPVATPSILPADTYTILGEQVRGDRLWFAASIVGVTIALLVLFRYTGFGLATRAAAETEKGAQVTGLSPERIALANWALGAVVAGIAGILIAPIVPIVPVSYTLFIVPALAAALVGNFTALVPAVAAGLFIGMVQSELVFLSLDRDWLPQRGAPEFVPLALILVVLIVRGRPLPERGAIAVRTLGRAPRPRSLAGPTAIGFALGVTALLVTDGGYRLALILTFIYAIIILSWVVVTGYAGQVSLAQLSLAGVGAFMLHRLAESWGVPFPFAPLLAACAAAVIGVVFGLPALRIRGLPIAVVTLALAVALEAFWFRNPEYNGGLAGAPIEAPSLFGIDFRVDALSSRLSFGMLCLVTLTLVAAGVAWLRRSRLGDAMLAVKANERSTAAAGINVARVKLVAFGIGAFIAGLGGSLLAYQQGGANASTYDAVAGIGLFATAYLIGLTSVSGGIGGGVAAAGGIIFIIADRNLELGEWYAAIAGLFLIFTVIRHPEGVIGELHHVAGRLRARRHPADEVAVSGAHIRTTATAAKPAPRALADAGPAVLSVRSVTVRYGVVVAVDGVSFDVPSGLLVGLIGPNGAGKTTLMDAVSGFVPAAGAVRLDDRQIETLKPHERVRLGLGRTFQGVELYEDLTVEENIIVGQEAARHGERSGTVDRGGLDEIYDRLAIGALRDRPVAELSSGYRQLVSVGRALAGRPKVLLLDEPASGLDREESQWLGHQLLGVRDTGTAILLIDHDMSLVLSVCDHIHVLDLGQLIASGTPAEVQADPRVAGAYLGSTHAVDEQESV